MRNLENGLEINPSFFIPKFEWDSWFRFRFPLLFCEVTLSIISILDSNFLIREVNTGLVHSNFLFADSQDSEELLLHASLWMLALLSILEGIAYKLTNDSAGMIRGSYAQNKVVMMNHVNVCNMYDQIPTRFLYKIRVINLLPDTSKQRQKCTVQSGNM